MSNMFPSTLRLVKDDTQNMSYLDTYTLGSALCPLSIKNLLKRNSSAGRFARQTRQAGSSGRFVVALVAVGQSSGKVPL